MLCKSNLNIIQLLIRSYLKVNSESSWSYLNLKSKSYKPIKKWHLSLPNRSFWSGNTVIDINLFFTIINIHTLCVGGKVLFVSWSEDWNIHSIVNLCISLTDRQHAGTIMLTYYWHSGAMPWLLCRYIIISKFPILHYTIFILKWVYD